MTINLEKGDNMEIVECESLVWLVSTLDNIAWKTNPEDYTLQIPAKVLQEYKALLEKQKDDEIQELKGKVARAIGWN